MMAILLRVRARELLYMEASQTRMPSRGAAYPALPVRGEGYITEFGEDRDTDGIRAN